MLKLSKMLVSAGDVAPDVTVDDESGDDDDVNDGDNDAGVDDNVCD